MLNIGIIGARVRNSQEDFEKLRSVLMTLLSKAEERGIPVRLVSGGCSRGGDRFAEILAIDLKIPIIIHYPDKSKLPKSYTKKHYRDICFERNTLIANDSDILIALVSDERVGGTEDTIKKFLNFKSERKLVLL